MKLTGDDTPEAGNDYAIHIYKDEYKQAVTVYYNGSVGLDKFDAKGTQRFTCVGGEGSDPLGFKCASCGSSGDKTKYLGFNAQEVLQCDADAKKDWECFWTDDAWGGGFTVKMKKDDHHSPLAEQSKQLKMLASSSTVLGFTKWN